MGIIQKPRHIIALFFVTLMLAAAIPGPLVLAATTPTGGGSNEAPYTPQTSDILEARIKVHQRYYWLRSCFQFVGINKTTSSDMESWDFFQDSNGGLSQIVGNIYGPGADAVVSCESEDSIRGAFELLGFDTSRPRDVFCNLESAYNGDKKGDKQYCLLAPDGKDWNVEIDYDWKGDYSLDKFRKSFEKMADAKSPGAKGFSAEAEYLRLYLSFNEQCNPKVTGNYPSTGDPANNDPNQYKIPVIYKDGNKFKVGYLLVYGASDSKQLAVVETIGPESNYSDGGQDAKGKVVNCGEAAVGMRANAEAFRKYLEQHPDEAVTVDPAKYGGTNGQDGGRANSCEASNGVLAWFGCGIIEMMDGVVSFLDNQIRGLLTVHTEAFSNADGGLKKSWGVIRNLSYLILIPMMMLMVIGTALEFGPFDAYTVKKALPRMLAAVIFMSVSYYLCIFLIEVSNAVGAGILNLISAATPGGAVDSMSAIFDQGEGALFSSLTGAGAVIGVATGAVTWGILGSFALVTIIALLIGYVILVIRQVLIVMLVVLSPLAILVWIFPGNDNLWKIWRTTFTAMLMMFPLIMVLIASGRFFAGTADQIYTGGTGTFIKLIAYIGPYFFIPATFKLGLGIFGNIAGMMNDRGRGLFDRQRKNRQGTRAQGWQDFKSGSGKGRFRQMGAVRVAGKRVTGGLRGNIGPGSKAYRDARWDAIGGNAAADFMKSAAFQAQQDNDPVLQAAASGKTRAEAITNMQRNFGVSQADAERHVTNAQATIGLGRQQQLAAAQQLVNTGTGYTDIEQLTKTLATAADGNVGTGSRLAGFANAATKRVGRWDLSPSFTELDGLVQKQMGGANGAPTQVEFDKATMKAVRSSTDARTLAATSKPAVFRNINAVAARAQSTVTTMDEVDRNGFMRDLTATAIEARSNISSMGSDNVKEVQTLISNFGGEHAGLHGPGMVEDGTARVYKQINPVTGAEIRYRDDPENPSRRPPDPGGE